ncbi:hypothetical protein R1flu_009412 [Riccia fluitans]|uniref:Vps72/YL1 C-terminal domain-containing protein n=1 Tax=Riccia fluitans TaxID=41844 RepID=A0ABD1Z2U9_9MARC
MKRKSAQLDSISNSASATPVAESPQSSVVKTNNTSSGAVGGVSGSELSDSDVILPSVLHFKRSQLSDRYPKGHSRGRHWKHLKQIIQAENYLLYPPDEPNYISIDAPPSMYPAKKYCDITGFEAPYTDPRTKLRYANAEVFKKIRSMPDEFIQGYLALRNAAVIIK